MLASSDSQILSTERLAETYLETGRANGSFKGVRRWRVVAIKHFPDSSTCSIEHASTLTKTGLTTINLEGNEFHIARLNVVACDLTKTQAKKLILNTRQCTGNSADTV